MGNPSTLIVPRQNPNHLAFNRRRQRQTPFPHLGETQNMQVANHALDAGEFAAANFIRRGYM